MIALNDNSIAVGEIKQLLHNFNLPQCQIGNSNPSLNSHFIYNDKIYRWTSNPNSSELIGEFCDSYIYGQEYLNLTTNLKINNMIYDRPTHRYLGNYLRFLRDFNHIDLMSMYNCCDREIRNYNFKFMQAVSEKDQSKMINYIDYKSKEAGVTTYVVPIRSLALSISLHTYAIAEMSLYINHPNISINNKKLEQKLGVASYVKAKINDTQFFDFNEKINSDPELVELFNKYSNYLELLIKVPESLNTSITVLEGKYFSRPKNNNSYIIYKVDEKLIDSGFQICAQLLSTENTEKQYLLADRLIEYLTENVINNLSPSYEIKRYQQVKKREYPSSSSKYYGIWDPNDCFTIKKFICKNGLQSNFDTLGYIDKDVEKIIQGDLDNAKLIL